LYFLYRVKNIFLTTMGGITKKPNKEIKENDRKRQIQLKLDVLEDKVDCTGVVY
jgi:hypothetical protein